MKLYVYRTYADAKRLERSVGSLEARSIEIALDGLTIVIKARTEEAAKRIAKRARQRLKRT